MVPREPVSPDAASEPSGPRPGPLSRLFLGWRRLLTKVLRTRSEPVSTAPRITVSARIAEIAAYLRDPGGTLSAAGPASRSRLSRAGTVALFVGAALSVGAGVLAHRTWPQIAFYALWLVAWAYARRLIMRLAAGPARESADTAWAPSLLPESIAFFAPLDLIALAISAWLAYAGLVGLGVSRSEARSPVGWAYGGQVAVEIAAWIARGGLIAFIATRG
jgi:hypothetical protein